MKKMLAIMFISLLVFSSALKAQVCDAVTAEVTAPSPQTGSYNYFGVRVTLSQLYSEDVTVTGYIYVDGSPNLDNPYTLIITAGNISAESNTYFFQTSPADGAGVEISTVTPCPGLAESIASHQSFDDLITIFDIFLEMPNWETFIENLDTSQINEGGNEYLSNITGISLSVIAELNEFFIEYLETFISTFPELENMSNEQLDVILSEAIDIWSSNQNIAKSVRPLKFNCKNIFTISMAGSSYIRSTLISGMTNKISFDPCSDCKKVGRARMINYSLTGAAAGGYLLGFFGAWAGAVIGFNQAAREALACLNAANCK